MSEQAVERYIVAWAVYRVELVLGQVFLSARHGNEMYGRKAACAPSCEGSLALCQSHCCPGLTKCISIFVPNKHLE